MDTPAQTIKNILAILKDVYSQELANLQTSMSSNRTLSLTNQKFDLLMIELLRFLYIKKKITNDLSPSYMIDQVWHTLLQYPKLYTKVCCLIDNPKIPSSDVKLSIDTIIDHNPLGAHSNQREARQKRYARTLLLLKNVFDHHSFPVAWPPSPDIFVWNVFGNGQHKNDNVESRKKRKSSSTESNEAIVNSNSKPTELILINIDFEGQVRQFKVNPFDSAATSRLYIALGAAFPTVKNNARLYMDGSKVEDRSLNSQGVEDGETLHLIVSRSGC